MTPFFTTRLKVNISKSREKKVPHSLLRSSGSIQNLGFQTRPNWFASLEVVLVRWDETCCTSTLGYSGDDSDREEREKEEEGSTRTVEEMEKKEWCFYRSQPLFLCHMSCRSLPLRPISHPTTLSATVSFPVTLCSLFSNQPHNYSPQSNFLYLISFFFFSPLSVDHRWWRNLSAFLGSGSIPLWDLSRSIR